MVMPFVSDEVLDKLEENIKKISSVTSMLDNGPYTGADAGAGTGWPECGIYRYNGYTV